MRSAVAQTDEARTGSERYVLVSPGMIMAYAGDHQATPRSGAPSM